MSENWQAGDLALCVDDGPREFDAAPALKAGVTYRVYAVGRDPYGLLGLFLDEVDSDGFGGGYLADRFIKVTPPKAVSFDHEVIELMRGAPAKVDA